MGWTNEQAAMLIEEYSKHLCLYAVKHKDYHNKHLRSLALTKVTECLRALIPCVTEVDVQKKFLGLRTTYSNERKKLLAAMHSGMGADEVYKPSLWYFEKMMFLNESLEIRTHRTSFQYQRDSCSSTHSEAPSQIEMQESEYSAPYGSEDNTLTEGGYEIQEDGSLEASETPSTSRTDSEESTVVYAKRKCKRKTPTNKKDVDEELVILGEGSKSLRKLSQVVKNPPEKSSEDIFGEFVATLLKKIDDEDIKNEAQF